MVLDVGWAKRSAASLAAYGVGLAARPSQIGGFTHNHRRHGSIVFAAETS